MAYLGSEKPDFGLTQDLNEPQREAVFYDGGPLAGPGRSRVG